MCPNSLKQYLNGLEKDSDKNVKCMNNEWARLESFKTFSENCPASTLKLAKAGFYSTDNGQEAICFSCGLKNDIWTDTETVAEVHKRLSPDCKILSGDTTENVSIHGDDKESQGACGGREDNEIRREETNQHMKERNSPQTSQLSERNEERIISPIQSSNEISDNNSSENGRNFGFLNSNRSQNSENIPTAEVRQFPGITNEQPKHPEYAIKSERLTSYSNWTFSKVVKPEDLLEAGFFYCGMQDLVRCFFCGGGMKNWEYGDSPWIEHARWFPTCAYLKQCKGGDFINLCQVSSMTFPTQNNFQLRSLNSEPTTTVADQQITDLNSIAAKCVLDMGYTQPQVENAIKQTRQRIGLSENLKAQNLLEYLIDNSYKPANVPTSTSTVPSLLNHISDVTNSISSSRSSSHVENERKTSPKEERKLLEEENRCLKEQKICKVCMDKDANVVFLPCGHLVSCVECAHALRKCAVCRAIIQGTVRTYAA